MTFAELAAQFAAPTLVMDEGTQVYLNLTNVGMPMRPDLFDPHSVHFHGFPQAAPVFDGLPESSITIKMGATLTYFYNIVEPGTYLYHCHVEATEHMQMGMLGNLYVRPKQNGTSKTFNGRTYNKFAYNDGDGSTGYDVEAPLQVSGFDSIFHDRHIAVQPLPFAAMRDNYAMINGRGYPDTIVAGVIPAPSPADNGGKDWSTDVRGGPQPVTSLITAAAGQRILLRLSNVSVQQLYTIQSPGIPMEVVGINARLLAGPGGNKLYYKTHSVNLGGGESMDIILDTAGLTPGTYFLYTTNLNYLSNYNEDLGGAMTEIIIQ
jgi:FtsP/CotA-like multicopper oxidase with cupredoxin domain